MKTIDGHLTQIEKKAIKAMFDANVLSAKVGRKTYRISHLEADFYQVFITENQSNDYGLKVARTSRHIFQL